jgi:hypothetical protein
MSLLSVWVIDYTYSINLTGFRSYFVKFNPPTVPSRVGGVSVDVNGSGTVQITVPLAYGLSIYRTIRALYTPDMQTRSAQRIGRLLNVNWMQTHCDREYVCSTLSKTGMLMVPTGIDVLTPSGNGLYLLPHQPYMHPSPTADSPHGAGLRVALTAQCDRVLWYRRFGHLNMQSL